MRHLNKTCLNRWSPVIVQECGSVIETRALHGIPSS